MGIYKIDAFDGSSHTVESPNCETAVREQYPDHDVAAGPFPVRRDAMNLVWEEWHEAYSQDDYAGPWGVRLSGGPTNGLVIVHRA